MGFSVLRLKEDVSLVVVSVVEKLVLKPEAFAGPKEV
jgi:hypothetical protein